MDESEYEAPVEPEATLAHVLLHVQCYTMLYSLQLWAAALRVPHNDC